MNALDRISGVPTVDAENTIDLPVDLGPWDCGCELVFVEDPLRHECGDATHFVWRNRCVAHTAKTTIVFVPCDGVSIHVTPYPEQPAARQP